MPINPLKEFFKRKKAEVKFARAGPGQKLSSDTAEPASSSSNQDSTSARQAAAEAAMKRFNKDNTKPAQRPKLSSSATRPTSTSQSDSRNQQLNETKSAEPPLPQELKLVDGVPERSVQVFTTEELAQRAKQPDIDDDFFRLTVEDAKLFKQRYDEERARNEILRTSEMRRREAEAKKPTTNIARLRFKLPNDNVIEASFSGRESLNVARNWLVETCKEKFNLELVNFDMLLGLRPLKAADYDKSIKELGLMPATSLTVVQRSN